MDTRRASQHLMALTLLLAFDVVRGAGEDPVDIDAVLVNGVDTFPRAYRV